MNPSPVQIGHFSYAAVKTSIDDEEFIMKWWKKWILSGVGMLFLGLGESMRECRRFRVTHYDPKITKKHPPGASRNSCPCGTGGLRPVKYTQRASYNSYSCGTSRVHPISEPNRQNENRIVFLSDLHNRVYGSQNDILLKEIRQVNPQLILIGGDMLIGKKNVSPELALQFIRRLPEIAPVYYALGNHEQRLKSSIEKYGDVMYYYKKKLAAAGVHFLENESADVSLPGIDLRITGLALPLDSYEKRKRITVTCRDIRKMAGPADKTRYQILLAHNPAFVPAYQEWGADLVLCGHLHGGVLRIPGWRGVVTPQATFFPKYSGEMTVEDNTAVIVSKGLGTHTVNLRVFNPAEVIVIHL